MARIAGINIPPHKHAEISLTAIFGIGRTRARKICEASGIEYNKKIKDLTDAELEKVRDQVGQFTPGRKVPEVSKAVGFFDEFSSVKITCSKK